MVLTVPTDPVSDVHASSIALDDKHWSRGGAWMSKTPRFTRDGHHRGGSFFTNLNVEEGQGYAREAQPHFVPRNTNTCPKVQVELYDLEQTSLAGQMRRHRSTVPGVTSPTPRFRSHKAMTSNETRVPVMVDAYNKGIPPAHDTGRFGKGLLGPGSYDGPKMLGPAREGSPETRWSPKKDPTRSSWAFASPTRGEVFTPRTGPPEDLQQLSKLKQRWYRPYTRAQYSRDRNISPETWRPDNNTRYKHVPEVPEEPFGREDDIVPRAFSTPSMGGDGPPEMAGMPMLGTAVFRDMQSRLQVLPRERTTEHRIVRNKQNYKNVYETGSQLGPGAYLAEDLPVDFTYGMRMHASTPTHVRARPGQSDSWKHDRTGSPALSTLSGGRSRGLAQRWFYGDKGNLHTMGRISSNQGYRQASNF